MSLRRGSRPARAREVQALRQGAASGVLREALESGLPMGWLLENIKDVPHMVPEIFSIDAVGFTARITSAAAITQPTKQNLPGGYHAFLYKITGWMQAPATDPELAALCKFNIRDEERTQDLFTTSIEMATLVGGDGTANQPMTWERSLYKFPPGGRVSVRFEVDGDATNGYATNASATKDWGVTLHFGMYAGQ